MLDSGHAHPLACTFYFACGTFPLNASGFVLMSWMFHWNCKTTSKSPHCQETNTEITDERKLRPNKLSQDSSLGSSTPTGKPHPKSSQSRTREVDLEEENTLAFRSSHSLQETRMMSESTALHRALGTCLQAAIHQTTKAWPGDEASHWRPQPRKTLNHTSRLKGQERVSWYHEPHLMTKGAGES
jgi:hypothetical protein